jgi:hypothetical protein
VSHGDTNWRISLQGHVQGDGREQQGPHGSVVHVRGHGALNHSATVTLAQMLKYGASAAARRGRTRARRVEPGRTTAPGYGANVICRAPGDWTFPALSVARTLIV